MFLRILFNRKEIHESLPTAWELTNSPISLKGTMRRIEISQLSFFIFFTVGIDANCLNGLTSGPRWCGSNSSNMLKIRKPNFPKKLFEE